MSRLLRAVLVVPVLLATLAAVLLPTAPAHAEQTTKLADKTGFLSIEIPGRWREVPGGGFAFRATGFLNGVKRVELMARLHSDSSDVAKAWTGWKEERTKEDADAVFQERAAGGGRPAGTQWVVSSVARGAVDYVRVLSGASRSAVVWIRASGAPGQVDDVAFAVLAKAALEAPKPEEPAAGEPAKKPAAAEWARFQDPDLAIEVELPEGFERNKEVTTDGRRVIATKGRIGTDDEAYVDIYAFPEFDRLDALGYWWLDREYRGWTRPIEVVGSPPAFKILPADETWTRHVRLLDTKAGLYAIKIDAESKVGPAVSIVMDRLVRGAGFKVIRPRTETLVPPQGTQPLAGPTHTVLVPGGVEDGAAFAKACEQTEAEVTSLLGVGPGDRGHGVLRLFRTQEELDPAVRALGLEPGAAAYWIPVRRSVYARADALGKQKSHARLLRELARECVWRRFGFRPPYWVEYGTANVISSAAYNRGRTDLAHPEILQAARDAIGTTILFEQVRFWIPERDTKNIERQAIVWGAVLMLTQKSGPGKPWHPMFLDYVKRLQKTAQPAEANRAFDLSKDVAFVEEWKKFVRKL